MPIETRPPDRPIEEVTQTLSRLTTTGVHNVESLRPGAWSTVFGFEADGGRYIARFSRYREDFGRDAWAAQWSSNLLPIPRVSLIEPVDVGFVCISERVTGTPLDDLDGSAMINVLPSVFTMLDAMRRIDTSESSGAGGWNPHGDGEHSTWRAWIESVRTETTEGRGANWRRKLAASPSGIELFETTWNTIAPLLTLLPERRDVVHEDLLNANVFVHEDGVSGVFDWGCGMYGDHLYDVAWFGFWAPWYPTWSGIDFVEEFRSRLASVSADLEHFEERILAYMLHIAMCHMRYYATTERWDEMATLNLRTEELLQNGIHTAFEIPQ